MRSSIACQKCRRSKVRCVNHGVGTTCEACQKTGRVCEYPAAGSSGEVPQRRQSLSVGHDAPHDRTAESKTKRRRIAPTSNALKETPPTGTGLFDPQLFTPQVWTELFNIFEQHWATDLPFLHAPTFLDRLCQVDIRSLTDPFGSLVLAFLALTTPFHEAFVRRSWPGAPQPITPIDVAKKYAEAARVQLSGSMDPSKTTLETTQALLMLGLHEWGNSQAISSFLTIGNAIRLAQQLGCQYQDDLDDMQEACVGPLGAPPPRDQSREERLIREEEKRRTYWSCFVMDRYLSSGKYRSRSIHVEDMRIQLPCSERHFNFGLNVRTRMLQEDQEHFNLRHSNYTRSKVIRTPDMANGKGVTKAPNSMRDNDDDVKWEDQGDQEALVWFLKAMDIYGDIIRWSCTVTRRNEKRSPWDHQSTFYQFRKKHEDLKRELPFDLTLSPSRTNTHISARTARGYVLLHTVLTLCSITLHREYLAYLPFGHSKPTGPLDGPIPEGQPDDPEYWEKSARECFKATREFNDLMWTCRQRGVLVETPLTGFAVYHVVFTVLWCAFFPKMDQGNFLCTNGTRADELLFDNFDKSWTLLTHIQERLTMAKPWCRDIQKIYQQFKNSKKDHMSWVGSPISNNSNSTDGRRSVKEGGAGLMEYIHLEKALKEFGDFGKDEYVSVTDDEKVEIDLRRDLDDASAPNSPRVVKSEGGDTIEDSPESDSLVPPQGGFTAVNVSRSDNGTPKSTNGHTNAFGPVPPTQGQSFPHHSYNPAFASHSTDNQHLSLRGYPPMAQESDERARAHENHSVQDHSMIDQPVQHMFTQAEGQQMFNQKYNGYEWGMSTSLANFAQGNDFGAIGRGVSNWPAYEMPHQQFYNDNTHH